MSPQKEISENSSKNKIKTSFGFFSSQDFNPITTPNAKKVTKFGFPSTETNIPHHIKLQLKKNTDKFAQ